MHIPDGYLSPSTCAAFYAASAPFWYASLRHVKNRLSTRMVPLLSVFAAFSFVIMMFNLPLPGGTTGHAAGMGVAAIVLGPWAAILALSTALAIQAVFFGDGGITALGANCFNMAIVGSLAAYGVYRLLARGSFIASARRVAAAGVAGYAGINLAALCAAVEFGVQPMLFHDASGAPLYAPYPLRIAIPAMLIGHLTLAGLAEFIVTAGMVAYLQRADGGLLRQTAPDAPDAAAPDPPGADRALLPAARKLWLALAALLILTPLGILATGSAWGEWRARDFSDAAARAQMAAASGHAAPPVRAPAGLERLSSVWTAPLAGYAPAFLRSPAFGYFVSAAIGAGLIIGIGLIAGACLPARRFPTGQTRAAAVGRRRRGFVEKTAQGLVEALRQALLTEDLAASDGLLQRLDARVKAAGLGALIAAAVAAHRLPVLAAIFCATLPLAALSAIPLRALARRVWLAALVFTGAAALPAIFLTPGEALYSLPALHWEITRQGLRSAALLTLRAETIATLAALLALSTPWTRLLRALRFYRVPAVFVALLAMTWRYIFLLIQTAHEMFEARQCRLVGALAPEDRRRLAAASAGVLLGKSMQLSGEVHAAMLARGFRGEIYLLDEAPLRARDWMGMAAFGAAAAAAAWWGR